MSKDATQSGVSDEDVNDVIESGEEEISDFNKERLSAVEELAAAHRERRDAEMREAGHDVVDTTQDADEEDKPETVEKEGEKESEQQASAEQEGEDEYDTLVIDGKEAKRKKDEIYEAGKRALQKESAADARLEEATRILREAKEQSAVFTQNRQPSPGDAAPSSPSGNGPDAIDYAEIVEAIKYGEKDDAVEALRKLQESGRQGGQQLTPQDVMILYDEQRAFAEGTALLERKPEEGGYADLWEDPQLRTLMMQRDSELLSAGDKRLYAVRYKEIGDEVRAWRDKLAGKSQDQTARDTFKDREQRKAKQPDPIKGGSKRAVKEGGETKPMTEEQRRQATLDNMRNARHQNIG